MKKFYIGNKENLNKEELKTGCVSYARIVNAYIRNKVLCNNIQEIEYNLDFNKEEYYQEEIYQYFLCNLDSYEREILTEYGIILSYSNKLDLDILCVEHFGTSWDYVMTDIKWTEDFSEI